MKRLIAILICVLLLLAAGCTEKNDAAENDAASATQPPLSGEPMSSFPDTVGDLSFNTTALDGREIRAGVIREYDLVVINCWADWCGPCVGELAELARVQREHPNVLFIGLLCDPLSLDDCRAIAAEKGVTYPVLEPAGSLSALIARFDAIPATVFFDSTGHEIADPVIGAHSYAEWTEIIEDLLP